jgi:glucosyl-dolichyl phosphate glucuronosyltransferase
VTISIIIPTYNRAGTLAKTLASVYKQEGLQNVEVIVVDNGSTDNTREVCQQLEKATPALKYFYDAEPGLLTGRHLGALKAKGEVLSFLDDDVELSDTWLTGVREAFSNNDVQLATGRCLPSYQTKPPDWLNYFWYEVYGGKACTWLSLLDLGDAIIDIHPNYVWGLNFCIRKTALEALNGFHPDSTPAAYRDYQGDGETGLTMKAYQFNYKAIYHPKILLNHLVPTERLTIEYFEQRAFFQGFCNSFTDIRVQYKLYGKPKKDLALVKLIKRLARLPINRIRYLLSNPRKIRAIKSRLQAKEKEGYEMHQQAFKDNKKVKDWVLRNDYWDYKLPH